MEKVENQKYLELFDKIFGTNTKYIDTSKVPLLTVVYDRLREDISTVSDKCRTLRNQSIERLDALYDTFSDIQKELFEEYWDLEDQQNIELEQQIFMFGYIMAQELHQECKDIRNDKK